MADKKLDTRKLQDDIEKIQKFIEAIEEVGGEMPDLKKAVKGLKIAVDTGADVAAAAEETSQALKEYTDDLYRACPKGDNEYVCLAGIDRKWQARNVRWTLSFDQRQSVVNLSIRNTLRRYLPEMICQRLDACR